MGTKLHNPEADRWLETAMLEACEAEVLRGNGNKALARTYEKDAIASLLQAASCQPVPVPKRKARRAVA